jgi:hypothetical protein
LGKRGSRSGGEPDIEPDQTLWPPVKEKEKEKEKQKEKEKEEAYSCRMLVLLGL